MTKTSSRRRVFTRTHCALAAIAAVFSAPSAMAQALPWLNPALQPEVRAQLLVSAMTFEQKVAQLHGASSPIVELPECGQTNPPRHVPAIPALGIPTFRITNGPVGLGGGDCNPQDKATALPVALGLAGSFDPNLATLFGDLMGREARQLGLHELEGPGINMARVGRGGRNFEYFGEDPILAGTMSSFEVRGIQQNNIIAMVKHYALNDQEASRNSVSAVVDDRTLHQLYLLPYEMSVKDGGVASVMCSYNRVGGTYACENPYLLTTVLRGQWGFQGYVQSDFGATHSTAPAMNAGLDFEMQTGTWFSSARLKADIDSGALRRNAVDTALKRRYVQMFKFGVFDRPIVRTPINTEQALANGAISRQIAEQSAVLLKNEVPVGGQSKLLPLASGVTNILVVGQQTYAGAAVTGGGGSSRVSPTYTVLPVDGLRSALAAAGLTANVTSVIVTNTNTNLADAVTAAQAADVVIVMAGVVTAEGSDRPSLSLPTSQDAIIDAVASVNPRTVVVLKDTDPVLMPWIAKVPAVLEAWAPGQEDGNVVGRLLVGLANPMGKLPVTYPVRAEDTPTPPSMPERYPGTTPVGSAFPVVVYAEGLNMGYRWYDAQGIQPLFPFGHGLSYTSFEVSNVSVSPQLTNGSQPVTVSLTLRNSGQREGAEVPQVYLGLPSALGEPPKRLVAFQKTVLAAGESKTVSIVIDPRANSHPFSTWNTAQQGWRISDGAYQVMLGTSSANAQRVADVNVVTTCGTGSCP